MIGSAVERDGAQAPSLSSYARTFFEDDVQVLPGVVPTSDGAVGVVTVDRVDRVGGPTCL